FNRLLIFLPRGVGIVKAPEYPPRSPLCTPMYPYVPQSSQCRWATGNRDHRLLATLACNSGSKSLSNAPQAKNNSGGLIGAGSTYAKLPGSLQQQDQTLLAQIGGNGQPVAQGGEPKTAQ